MRVVVPVDDPRVEPEGGLVGRRERLEQRQQLVDARTPPRTRRRRRTARRTCFGPVDVGSGLLEAGRQLGLLAPQRQGPERLLGHVEQPSVARSSWPCTRPRPGKVHSGTTIGWPSRSYTGCSVNQPCTRSTRRRYRSGLTPPEATWVMSGEPSSFTGPAGGDGDGGGDDEVDGDDVDDALGHAGELLEEAAGVADDHRLGHAEAADPARPRLGERRLDDRRPHDRHRARRPAPR